LSRNGSGTYSLVAGNPVVSGTTITSTWANNTLSDIATALTASIANDGQTPILATLPMSTYRHTGVGNATARTDYAATGQVQDSSFLWGGTAGGGADALTIALTPVITAYATGQRYFCKTGASPNSTTTPTININSVGAKTFLRRDGSAIVAGDIPAGCIIDFIYDGTNMRLMNVLPVTGSTSITTLGTVTTGTWNATVIGAQYGGTGVAALTAYNVPIGNGTGAVAFAAPGAAGTALVSNGVAANPSFQSIAVLGTVTTGVWNGTAVTVPYGGTGVATFTDGGVLIGNGAGAVQVTTAGISGQVLTSNGAGVDPTFQDAASGGATYLRKTANYTCSASEAILASTTGGAWTLTLPASPSQFDVVGPVIDTDGTFATNNLTVARNGNNIMGLAENMTCDRSYQSFSLEYDDAANGWRLF
jgi:hypothetical protein